MNIEEIFSAIDQHIQTGIKVHQDLMDIYGFLSLEGYQKCQEYHYLSELKERIRIRQYYLRHYGKLINDSAYEKKEVIPQSWYKYNTEDVDNNTRKSAVREAIKGWVDWEQKTKQFWSEIHRELDALNEIATMTFIEHFITDVSNELVEAQEIMRLLEMIGYDVTEIRRDQDECARQYKKKIKQIY